LSKNYGYLNEKSAFVLSENRDLKRVQNCEKLLLALFCQTDCSHGKNRPLLEGFAWNFLL